MCITAAERLHRIALEHWTAGRPIAAHDAYRRALAILSGCTVAGCAEQARAVTDELRRLLLELGRDAEAAALSGRADDRASRSAGRTARDGHIVDTG